MNGAVGDDDCAKGLFCSSVGRAKDAVPPFTCLPYCNQTSDCGGGSPPLECIRATETLQDPAGYCAPRCFPFDDTCPPGDYCVKFYTTAQSATLACSNQVGQKQLGEACNGADCAPMLSCEDTGSGQICMSFCDSSHPCQSGACTVVAPGWYQVCVP